MSSISRIYHPFSLKEQEVVNLDSKASHHIGRVLRAKVGDALTLFSGKGGEYLGTIAKIDKKTVGVRITEFVDREVESPLQLHLAQGITRGEKMDFIIQKAVELGVKTITPLITERSNQRFTEEREIKRLEHWRSIAISACEQSGRNRVPEIAKPIAYLDWLQSVPNAFGFVLSPHVTEQTIQPPPSLDTMVYLIIGPEGGLSPREIAAAQQFFPLNIGPRVLRAETAPITAISILQFKFGDLGSI